MGRKRKQTHSLRGWFRRMFRQPPGDFYGRASVYLSGRRMEIEQFRRIRSYDLKIETLSARRLTLRGQILRTDFSKE